MRTEAILRKLYRRCRSWTHVKRFAVVMAACSALVRSKRASLTAIGRALDTSTLPKHAIKRIDRLLGNPRLHSEQLRWYREIAHRAVGRGQLVVVAIDWTQLNAKAWALSATVVGPGRGIPIYQEVHSKARGGVKFFYQFLRRLQDVLPQRARPVLIADAGFRRTFFRACSSLQIDFVVRMRGRATAGDYPSERVGYEELIHQASSMSQCLGQSCVYSTDSRGQLVRIVLGPKTHRAPISKDGVYERRALEPWLLATSIDDIPAAQLVRIYALRMQIEEAFRDSKSGRFGWGLELSGTRSCARFENLLLLAALAGLAVVLCGLAAEQAGLARGFQANTERRRRVLSVFRLGCEVLSRHIPLRITARLLHEQIATLDRRWTKYHRAYRGIPPHGLYCPDCGDNFAEYGWPPL